MFSGSVSLSLLSVVSLTSFFSVFLISKISSKIKSGALLDNDFNKPQAFHSESVARCGGLAGIISLIIFFIFNYLLFSQIYLDYLFLSFAIFLLGFLEDLNFEIKPNNRLLLMIIILLFFIIFFSVGIYGVDLIFLKIWMGNKIFATIFVLLCFLFVINGANLIDGFNGLLIIHLLIINFIILFINLNRGNIDFSMLVAGQIIVLFPLLIFNFPKAQIFLGDSGSYLFGSLSAFNVIVSNNLNPEISSFFFCIILFYLFFEVFFSFFRKILQKKSPFLPDENHLHMLVFRKLKTHFKNSNPITGLFINITYLSLVLPALFNLENTLFCRYWFFSLIIFYIAFYYFLYKFKKN